MKSASGEVAAQYLRQTVVNSAWSSESPSEHCQPFPLCRQEFRSFRLWYDLSTITNLKWRTLFWNCQICGVQTASLYYASLSFLGVSEWSHVTIKVWWARVKSKLNFYFSFSKVIIKCDRYSDCDAGMVETWYWSIVSVERSNLAENLSRLGTKTEFGASHSNKLLVLGCVFPVRFNIESSCLGIKV